MLYRVYGLVFSQLRFDAHICLGRKFLYNFLKSLVGGTFKGDGARDVLDEFPLPALVKNVIADFVVGQCSCDVC